MLEKVIIVVVVAVVVLAAGVAWWFENGSASHNEGGHAADVDSNDGYFFAICPLFSSSWDIDKNICFI